MEMRAKGKSGSDERRSRASVAAVTMVWSGLKVAVRS